jgi:hypothetical protein
MTQTLIASVKSGADAQDFEPRPRHAIGLILRKPEGIPMTSLSLGHAARNAYRPLSSRIRSEFLELRMAIAEGLAYLTRTGEQVQRCVSICEMLSTFNDETLARHGIAPQQIPYLAATKAGILPPFPAETRRSRAEPPTEEIQKVAA